MVKQKKNGRGLSRDAINCIFVLNSFKIKIVIRDAVVKIANRNPWNDKMGYVERVEYEIMLVFIFSLYSCFNSTDVLIAMPTKTKENHMSKILNHKLIKKCRP